MLKFYVAILLVFGIGRLVLTITYGEPTSGSDGFGGGAAIILVLAIIEVDRRLSALELRNSDDDQSSNKSLD